MTDGTVDKTKGKMKQAIGDLTDDERLRREGQADESAGKAKDVLNKVKDKAEDLVDNVKDRISDRT